MVGRSTMDHPKQKRVSVTQPEQPGGRRRRRGSGRSRGYVMVRRCDQPFEECTVLDHGEMLGIGWI